MAELVTVRVDGVARRVPAGTTVAAALANLGPLGVRRSVRGDVRGALCGMGVCFECRATVDGRPHARTCMLPCREGMEVRRDA